MPGWFHIRGHDSSFKCGPRGEGNTEVVSDLTPLLEAAVVTLISALLLLTSRHKLECEVTLFAPRPDNLSFAP